MLFYKVLFYLAAFVLDGQLGHSAVDERHHGFYMSRVGIEDNGNVAEGIYCGITVGEVKHAVFKKGARNHNSFCVFKPACVLHVPEAVVEIFGGEGIVVKVPDYAVTIVFFDKLFDGGKACSDEVCRAVDARGKHSAACRKVAARRVPYGGCVEVISDAVVKTLSFVHLG